jgi:uncharacterized protein (TIGR02118 family)
MIKCYLFLDAPPGTDPFARRGEAAAALLASCCRAAVGYCQTRSLPEQLGRRAEAPFAGVAEVWFLDPANGLALLGDPTAFAPLLAKGATVAAAVYGVERIILRLPEQHSVRTIKGVFPFRRRSDLAVAEFQHYWLHRHGPLAARTEEALLYVQCHPLRECYVGDQVPDFDGVTELHWPDVAAARRAMASRQMREDQARDAENFTAPGSVRLFLAEEECVRAP